MTLTTPVSLLVHIRGEDLLQRLVTHKGMRISIVRTDDSLIRLAGHKAFQNKKTKHA